MHRRSGLRQEPLLQGTSHQHVEVHNAELRPNRHAEPRDPDVVLARDPGDHQRRRSEREERGDRLGDHSEVDRLRHGGEEEAHSRSDEVYQVGSLGHAVLSGEGEGAPLRVGVRGEPSHDYRDVEVFVRFGNDNA